LIHWTENIAAGSVRENTFSGYRVAVTRHLIPGVGAHRLDRLEPRAFGEALRQDAASGSAPATAHQAHRTIRTALNEAVQRGHLVRNPATVAKAPRLPDAEVESNSVEEIRPFHHAAGQRRNNARWALALALGLRQSEALGLRWPDVNVAEGLLTVRRGRVRPRWRHGCNGFAGGSSADTAQIGSR
jgi:integrase